jgi:hypothetical protein
LQLLCKPYHYNLLHPQEMALTNLQNARVRKYGLRVMQNLAIQAHSVLFDQPAGLRPAGRQSC